MFPPDISDVYYKILIFRGDKMAINDIQRNFGPSASQSHTSEAIGHAEDFSKIIVNIDPDKTFFLSE